MTTTANPSTHEHGGQVQDRRWLALGIIAIAQLMVVLDASIVNIALPSAQRDLGITDVNRQWVVTAYTLAFGGLLLLGGRIADYAGRKRTFIVGLIGFAFASALGGMAQNQELLFGARALQGVFAALLAPSALSLIAVTFTEGKERARAFGVFGAISGGGAAIGLVLGGVLTEKLSWEWCFWVNVPIAILTALAAISVVKESKATGDTRYDVVGALLATAGLVSLVYGFTQAAKPDVGWTAGSTLAYLGVAVLLLIAFGVWEARISNPLLPLRIPRDRNRGGSFLTFLLVGAGLFAMFLFLTYYFQGVLGWTPLESGYAFLPFSGGIIVSAGIVSQLLPKIGPKPLMVVGLAMAVAGMLYLTQITATTGYVSHVLPSMLLISFGMAGVFIPASSTALVGVTNHDAGIASALLNTTQQVGGSLGLALLSTLANSATNDHLAENGGPAGGPTVAIDAVLTGFHVAFFWGAMLLLAGLLVTLVFINAKKDDIPAEGAMPGA